MTMGENLENLLKNIKKFDSSFKTAEERLDYINNLIENNNNELLKYLTTYMLEEDSRIEQKPVNIAIEQLGTYLIRARDNESCRSGEYSFYETEADYRGYKIGMNSFATDIEERNDLEYDEFHKNSDGLNINVYEIFNFGNMSVEEKKRLIKHGLREKDNDFSRLQDIMQDCYDYILDTLEDERDKIIIELTVKGNTENEIAETIGIARQNVNKRMKRICENKI